MTAPARTLFLVEQYQLGVAPGLAGLASVAGTVWCWGVELVDDATSLAVVEAVDLDALLAAARSVGVELHHVSRARPLR